MAAPRGLFLKDTWRVPLSIGVVYLLRNL
jgi:hypothetical protein